MTQELSTFITTHEIHYMDGDAFKSVRVSEEEAAIATEAWKIWRPVPVPNKKDPERSSMMINPNKIDTIKRYRNLT